MDERRKMHRFYSTRWAVLAGTLAMLAWFQYSYFADHVLRWDIVAIMMIMAVTKVLAMLYYQFTN